MSADAASHEAGAGRIPAALSLPAALDLLCTPQRVEALSSVLGGPGVLVIALEMPSALPSGEALEVARRALSELPCPSIGVRHAALAGALATWARGLDAIVVDAPTSPSPDEAGQARAAVMACTLEPLLRATERNPQAALLLVQLLRHGQGMELHDALVAESLAYSTLQAGPEFARWLSERSRSKDAAAQNDPEVLAARHGDTLDLVLNRPARRNAFSAGMRDALCEGLAIALCDPTIERVTLRGLGPDFCSGGDLDEFGQLPDPATAHIVRSTRNPGRMLVALRERVSVRVHGACVGAGVELPAFAERVVATPDARFRLPEVAMGLVPGAGGTASLPRRIGRQRSAWLALSGVAIDAPTALDWGLIDSIEAEPA